MFLIDKAELTSLLVIKNAMQRFRGTINASIIYKDYFNKAQIINIIGEYTTLSKYKSAKNQ
jgi:hypothetical protein